MNVKVHPFLPSFFLSMFWVLVINLEQVQVCKEFLACMIPSSLKMGFLVTFLSTCQFPNISDIMH